MTGKLMIGKTWLFAKLYDWKNDIKCWPVACMVDWNQSLLFIDLKKETFSTLSQ